MIILEPNRVNNNNDSENKDSKGYNSNNNFKLKGPKGWAHKFKKGAKQAAKNTAEAFFKNIMKKIFFVLFKYIFIILLIAAVSVLVAAVIWYVINSESDKKTESAIRTVVSNSTTISEKAKDTYEKIGSLVYFKNEEYKEIANQYLDAIKKTNKRLYEVMSKEDYIGDHKISELSYVNGFDISNAYEFILNAERLNFNRISWKKSDRTTGEITELETQVDEETNLKYPKNDEDTTKELEYFVDMVTPYLQSYVIPNTMLSGTVTKADNVQVANFAFQIIDKGYSVIDVLQYTLQTAKRDRTKQHYITSKAKLTKYEKQEKRIVTNEDGTTSEVSVTVYGYSSSELKEKKESARKQYETAFENHTEQVKITATPASEVEKQFLYPIIKADTLKQFMRAEYEQIKYSDEDVENYENSDYDYVTTVREFTRTLGLSGYRVASSSGWSVSSGQISVTIDAGEYITTKYIWNDKLEERYNEKRNYEVNDVSEFVNQTDKIVEVEERKLTEKEKTAGSRPDLRLDASEIFGMTEVNYYEALEEEKDITRIDMINATPSIYNDYLFEGEVYSDYIGFSRSYLSLSYTLLNRHLTELEELRKSTTISGGILLGLSGLDIIWPLATYGSISSGFGLIRNDLGQTYPHSGVDITPLKAEDYVYPDKRDSNGWNYTGSYVYAASSGVVSDVFKETPRDQGNVSSYCPDTAQGANYSCQGKSTYGRNVKIKSDDGYTIVYGHLYEVADGIEVGTRIEQGQVIGVMGTTGSSTGVHLHFEVRNASGVAIDPMAIASVLTARELIKNGNFTYTTGSSISVDTGSNAPADSSTTGTKYNGSSFVFSQEITSTLSSASYNNSTFNKTLTSGGSYYKTTAISNISGTAYSARTKPSTFDAKDAAIKNMSDLEILARTIYAEQGSNSEEAGVLVGISVLNRVKNDKSSISAVLTGKYNSDTEYNYNCVSGNVFWGSIPQFAKDLALKACAAMSKGSYVINGVECIGVESFHASTTINSGDSYRISAVDLSVGSTWYNWKRYLVLENTISGFKYTGFYGG